MIGNGNVFQLSHLADSSMHNQHKTLKVICLFVTYLCFSKPFLKEVSNNNNNRLIIIN